MNAIRYNMFGFFRQCVEVYCELANLDPNSLNKVATPGMDDHQLKPEDFETEGLFAIDAAKNHYDSIIRSTTSAIRVAMAHLQQCSPGIKMVQSMRQPSPQTHVLYTPHTRAQP